MGTNVRNRHTALNNKNALSQTLPSGRVCLLITGLCVLMHISCIFFFIFSGIWPALVINAAELMVCIWLLVKAVKKEYRHVILGIYFELGVHSILMTALTGWETGFYLLMLLVISVLFFCPFSNRATPLLLSLGIAAAFLALRIVFFLHAPPFPLESDALRSVLYLFNAVFSVFPLIFLSGQYYDTVNRSQRRLFERNQNLMHLASVDPLTGLLNRRSMVARLEKASYIRETTGKGFALAICDIDDFKKINDNYGHDCGDYVLKTLSSIFRSQLQDEDAVCRWGGEELLILFNENAKVQEACENLREAVSAYPFGYANTHLSITMTIGLCLGENGLSVNEMLILADRCLYFGKNCGKNCVVSN